MCSGRFDVGGAVCQNLRLPGPSQIPSTPMNAAPASFITFRMVVDETYVKVVRLVRFLRFPYLRFNVVQHERNCASVEFSSALCHC